MTDQPADLPDNTGADDEDAPTVSDAQERQRLLNEIFIRQARAIASILEHTPPEKLKSSMIQAITQWSRLQGLASDTLPDPDKDAHEEKALGAQIKALTGPVEPEVDTEKLGDF